MESTPIADMRADEAVLLLDDTGLLVFADRLMDEERYGELHHLADSLIRQRQTCRDALAAAEERLGAITRSAADALHREQAVVDRLHRGLAILQGGD